MKRYLFDYDIAALPRLRYDVLIVGSGIAGLYAGLHLDPSMKCAIITKVHVQNGNSWFAQGGIASVISPEDNFESHIHDTIVAGAGLCNEEAVRVLVTEGPENIRELIELNVPFDTNPEGELLIGREGGHSFRRIVHCGGDATGRETTRRLGQIAIERKNVDMLFDTYLVDILTEGGRVVGALIDDGQPKVILTSNIIMATGGIGALYQYTTNPSGAIGDGIAAAVRAGAVTENMEMVQFHPTTLYAPGYSERLFLISEAVRGEGGLLRNHKGERFMVGKHPMSELAPRDIVTRGILAELAQSGEAHVFLDVSSMDEKFFSHRFPTIYGECRRSGIKVPTDAIPVRPAQHYQMGGIKTDLDGMTCIEGLYACGESASTGIHGGNRLASNSLLECLVFGRRAAKHICAAARPQPGEVTLDARDAGGTRILTGTELANHRRRLRETMTRDVAAIRTVAGLLSAKAEVDALRALLDDCALSTKAHYELYSMAQVASLVIEGALARRESVGAHYLIG